MIPLFELRSGDLFSSVDVFLFAYENKDAAEAEQALPAQRDFEDLDDMLWWRTRNIQALGFNGSILAIPAGEILLIVNREMKKWEQEHSYLLISVLYNEKLYWLTLREDFPIEKEKKKNKGQ